MGINQSIYLYSRIVSFIFVIKMVFSAILLLCLNFFIMYVLVSIIFPEDEIILFFKNTIKRVFKRKFSKFILIASLLLVFLIPSKTELYTFFVVDSITNKNYTLDNENYLKKEIDYIIKKLNKIQKNT